jgi:uncharacterized peroxidase-related enzyme
MPWTVATTPDAATAELKPVYARIHEKSTNGRVSNLWQVLGSDPRGLDALYTLYRTWMDDPSPLTIVQAEMIALVVSATNGCGYCVAHHGVRLAHVSGDEAMARAVAKDYRETNLTARDRVLLDYAVALSCEPSERKLEDIDRVREYGFDDAGIVKATEITGLYNLVNRVVSALGVELEPGLAPWEYGSQK